MKVFLSELAEIKLLRLSHFLLQTWNLKGHSDFVKNLSSKINQISEHPESCPESTEFKGVFKCVITDQTTLYYRLNNKKDEIEVITVFDTRQTKSKLENGVK